MVFETKDGKVTLDERSQRLLAEETVPPPYGKSPGGEWIDQNYQIDRYGVALMMIREGCSDPAGLARRILAEFGK